MPTSPSASPSGPAERFPPAPERPARTVLSPTAAFLLTAAILPLVLSCGPTPGGRLLGLVPKLSAELAAHLEADSPNAFRIFARGIDPDLLLNARTTIQAALPNDPKDFRRLEPILMPHLDRLVTVLAEEFSNAVELRILNRYVALPDTARIRVCDLIRRTRELGDNRPDGPAATLAAYEELIREGLPYADVVNLGNPYASVCEALPRLGRKDELEVCALEGARHSLAFGDTALACQLLGMVGVQYQQRGDTPNMRRYWDRAMDLARRSRSWQEARILSFYASHYYAQGDAARALELIRQAEERCRELGVPRAEVRFLFSRLNLFARFACWDLVDRGLPRSHVLLRHRRAHWDPAELPQWEVRFDVLRMRSMAARGALVAAERTARQVLEDVDDWPIGPRRQQPRLEAIRVLMAAERITEAQVLLKTMIDECDSSGISELRNELRVELATARIAAGDTATARLTLAEVDTMTAGRPVMTDDSGWHRYDALRARLHRLSGHRSAAAQILAEAFGRMETIRSGQGHTPEGLLVLGAAEPLRTEFHALVADDPAAGYCLELAWNSFRLQGRRTAVVSPSEVAAIVARDDTPRLPPIDAADVHCVYRWERTGVIRWTRTGDRVVREVLPIAPTDLARRVTEAVGALTDEAGVAGWPGVAAVHRLDRLARELLPPAAREATATRLLVSPDGPLCRLPFEALSLGPDPYRPYLLEHDVVVVPWLADYPAAARVSSRRPLVVTEPAYHPELRRRWSILNEPTPASAHEVIGLVSGDVVPVALHGAAATRRAVMAGMASADEIDIAGHFVSDPELPYVEYLPLAADSADTGLLGMADIRNLNLEGCGLVILWAAVPAWGITTVGRRSPAWPRCSWKPAPPASSPPAGACATWMRRR